jgi:hypothetical protein
MILASGRRLWVFGTESAFSIIAIVPAGGHCIKASAAFVPSPFDNLRSQGE